MIQILTAINTAVTPTAWRQTWIQMSHGIKTKGYFVTWHNSEMDAKSFLDNYLKKLGNKPPETYYVIVEFATKQPCNGNEPKGEFIQSNVIPLAP
jgi:hypothetical protein